MVEDTPLITNLIAEVQRLEAQLAEAEDVLTAIRAGEVDAFVVSGFRGERIHTLVGAEFPYQRLVESMSEGAVTVSSDGTVLYYNARFADLLKLPIEGIAGSSLRLHVVESDLSLFDALLEKGGVESSKGEINLKASDGTHVPAYLSMNSLEVHEIPAVCIVVTDLTERRRTEEQLRESEARHRRIFESNMLGIVFWDIDGGITDANDAFLDMVGYTGSDVSSGQVSWRQMTPPAYLSRDEEALTRISETGISGTYEKEFIRKDGSRVPVVLASAMLNDRHEKGVAVILNISDRKRAEEDLRQQALLLNTSFDAILVYRQDDGVITYWNKGAEELYGYSPDQAIGQVSHDLLKSSYKPEVVLMFQSELQRSGSWSGVLEHYTREGRKVQASSRQQVVQEPGGRRLVLETNRDITESIEADQSLRRVNRSLTILTQVNHAVIRATDECQLLDAICKIIVEQGNYPAVRVGFIDEGGLNTFHFASQAYSIDHYPRLSADLWTAAESISEPARIAIRAGEPYVVRYDANSLSAPLWQTIAIEHGLSACLALPLVGNVGAFGALCLYVAEIDWRLREEEMILLKQLAADIAFGVNTLRQRDEHRRADDALHSSERFRRMILESAPMIVFALDESGRIILSEGSGVQKLGRSGAEMVGQSVFDLFHDNLPMLDAVRRALSGDTFNVNLEIAGRVLDTWYAPVYDANGDLSSVIGVAADITERVKAEEALNSKEEELRQAQKMEAVGRLAGGVAHDFNNLLTAINGYSDLTLMELKDADPLRANIEEIKKAGDRAAGLTRQLLTFSRRQVLKSRTLDLNQIVADLNNMLSRLIGEDIELETVLEPNLDSVLADPSQIDQVIVNILVNARDAMPLGGKITIETANVFLDAEYASEHLDVAPGHYIMLAITDTGVGMDLATQERIFEPFFTTKESGKGTGLGLATVYGIVKQSGGCIRVFTELQKGTTFKIYLPQSEETVEMAPAALPNTGLPKGSETVLLVEDDEVLAKVVQATLQKHGYTVLTAVDGFGALLASHQQSGPIHLLLTDIVMPRMSGRELADQIKAVRPEVKVLFMSGYPDNEIAHPSALGEGVDFLEKPFSPKALCRKVRDVLDS
jgi:PAS domain S-box-containing protein